MTDFERIWDSALGYLKPSERADWVRDISQEGSDYDAAYQKLMDVRERLSAGWARRRLTRIWKP